MTIKNSKDIFLLASVFVTGVAVLIIEIVATRILSPYYGNTIYTTSAVIGTILAALSLGYWLGGKLADKHPDFLLFYLIIFASGLITIATHPWAKQTMANLDNVLPLSIGPLIASILIFFIPGFLFGTLSPFAVKLHQTSNDQAGKKSGEVFFWSTFGSILGSISSGFILIPHFGTQTIIIGTGIVITLWGGIGALIYSKKLREPKIFIPAIIIVLGFIFALLSFIKPTSAATLYQKDGVYEKITIFDGLWKNQPARFLMQDKSSSAAMYLHSNDLAYDYTQYYQLYQLINPNLASAFLIGGGAYSIPKAILRDNSETQITVSEIEPDLYQLAQTYFNLKPTSRLTNTTQDGRQFLRQHETNYNLIVSDVYYSFYSIPVHFTTQEFFKLAKSRLTENGVFVGNFVGDLNPTPPSLIWSEIKTFKSIFPNSYFFAVNSPDAKIPQNIIFMGINGNQTINWQKVPALKNPLLINLQGKEINLSSIDFSKHELLTDDFAPTDYFVSKTLNRWY